MTGGDFHRLVAEAAPPLALVVGTAYVMPRDRSQLWATLHGLIRRYDPHRRGIFAMWIGYVPLVQVYDADLIKEITSCVWQQCRPRRR